MEVHQHPHTDPAYSGKGQKKFTHYIWEFFMLFLAVFAGFLAENQREHYVEHAREKQFIKSLINDVEGDTTGLNLVIGNRNMRETRLDSLMLLLNNADTSQHTGTIYYLATTVPRTTFVQ